MNFCSEFLCVLHTITIDHLNKFRVKRNFCQTWKILQTTKLIILRNHEWNFSQQPYIMNFPKSLPSLPLREINQVTLTREKFKVFHFSLVKVNYLLPPERQTCKDFRGADRNFDTDWLGKKKFYRMEIPTKIHGPIGIKTSLDPTLHIKPFCRFSEGTGKCDGVSGNKIVPNCMVQSTFVVVTLF